MTLETTPSEVRYNGNDVTLPFATTFKFLNNVDLVVNLIDANGVPVLQTEGGGSDYTVTGAGDAGGGTVTMAVAPPTGEVLWIRRDSTLKQTLDLVENDGFPADDFEKSLDAQVAKIQEVDQTLDRALGLQGVEAPLNMDLPLLADRVGTVLAFDPITGKPIVGPETTALQDLINGATELAPVLTIAALRARSIPSDGGSITVAGYYASGDGGGGPFVFDADSVLSDNGGTVIAPDSGSGRWIRLFSVISYKMFGVRGAGLTFNDADTVKNALIEAVTVGAELYVDSFTSFVNIEKPIVLTDPFVHDLKWIGLGSQEMRYTGSVTNRVFDFKDTNGKDFTAVDFFLNQNLLASKGIVVENPSTAMTEDKIGVFRLDFKSEGAFMNDDVSVTNGSSGFFVDGGWSEGFINMRGGAVSRALGAGIPAAQGSVGGAVGFNDIDAYCPKVTLSGVQFAVTNNEADGDATNNVDCDGFVYFVPSAADNGGNPIGAQLILNGPQFINCKGRAIKTQGGVDIVGWVYVRRDLEQGIANAHEVDVQGGSASDLTIMVDYQEKSGGGTVFGASHTVFTSTNNETITPGGSVINVAIGGSNEVPKGTDTIPFVTNFANTTVTDPVYFTLRRCRIIGQGGISRVLKTSQVGSKSVISVKNVVGDIATSLIQLGGSMPTDAIINTPNCANTGSGTPKFIETFDSTEPFMANSSGAFGFLTNYVQEASGSGSMGPTTRTGIIAGDTTNGGVIVPGQTIVLADDAEKEFDTTGEFGRFILTNTFNDTTQISVGHDFNSFDAVDTATVEYGTTSNPDVDGKINLWKNTTNETLNMKNRLGSSRSFTMFAFTS